MAGYPGYPMGGQPPPGQSGHGGFPYGQGQGGGGGQWQGVGYGRPAPPPSDHYGNYGQQFHQNVFEINAWQAYQMSGPDELYQLFMAKASQRNQGIQAEELCNILNESPKIRDYYRIHWSLELCKIMVAMLDRSKDGFMQYNEFQELMKCLTFWYQTFCQYDADRSGFIEAQELGRVIRERYSYALSPKAMEYLLKRYSKALDDGRLLIALDDFVALSVRLRAYTEAFRARDRQAHGVETGRYEFSYDDFIQTVMCL